MTRRISDSPCQRPSRRGESITLELEFTSKLPAIVLRYRLRRRFSLRRAVVSQARQARAGRHVRAFSVSRAGGVLRRLWRLRRNARCTEERRRGRDGRAGEHEHARRPPQRTLRRQGAFTILLGQHGRPFASATRPSTASPCACSTPPDQESSADTTLATPALRLASRLRALRPATPTRRSRSCTRPSARVKPAAWNTRRSSRRAGPGTRAGVARGASSP